MPGTGAGDRSAGGATHDVLAEVYDPEVLAAIDGPRPRRRTEPVRGLRGHVAGAVVVAAVSGTRPVLTDEPPRPEVEEVRPEPAGVAERAVTVHLVWGDPAAGVALVRPWLLTEPPGPLVRRLAGSPSPSLSQALPTIAP
ncbi:MAG: hypothetical protein D6683_14555 [Actinomyces sp.]|nr:MAG: hypothetical protein D6683_14555 [Actinomyces sp.]